MPNPPKNNNRIPFEEVGALSAYELPSLGSGSMVPSVKKKDKNEAGKEHIEDVEDVISPLTAEKLQEITAEAEREAREQGYQEGFEQGEKQGIAQGEQRAYGEAKAKLTDQMQRLNRLTQALMDPVQMQDQELENTIIDMAVQLAQHLIQQELSQDPTCLFKTVKSVVANLPIGQRAVKIYVNDDDLELLTEAFANSGNDWTFYTDPTLTRGGCRVETDMSIADYSVESRIKKLLEEASFAVDVADEGYEPRDYAPKNTTQTPAHTPEANQVSDDESLAETIDASAVDLDEDDANIDVQKPEAGNQLDD